MATCKNCKETAVWLDPHLCANHFTEWIETTIKNTIDSWGLLKKNDSIGVACSGGKDSLLLLTMLKKLGYNVEALTVDEGIANYRDGTIKMVKQQTDSMGVALQIMSFEEEFGSRLDDMKLESGTPCRTCGILRRAALAKLSKEKDIITTGHNIDDELQALMLNLALGSPDRLARQGPATHGLDAGFTKKVKPLYFIPEKAVRVYCVVNNIDVDFTECPNSSISFRGAIRDALNELETSLPGSKRALVWSLLPWCNRFRSSLTSSTGATCPSCGSISAGGLCGVCQVRATEGLEQQ